ncbi:hypothetical protein, partial [Sphingomonas sp. DC1200-1]|uniref:hypothetical protein n=1 Tax=Sphingomonas sp. DC1200-1 TaxID=2804660 RepID=UPI003CEBCC9C
PLCGTYLHPGQFSMEIPGHFSAEIYTLPCGRVARAVIRLLVHRPLQPVRDSLSFGGRYHRSKLFTNDCEKLLQSIAKRL